MSLLSVAISTAFCDASTTDTFVPFPRKIARQPPCTAANIEACFWGSFGDERENFNY